ncbi:MAG: VTT domain-containing protein [Polyangiaceae bacterium]
MTRYARLGLAVVLGGLLVAGVALDLAGVISLEPAAIVDLARSSGGWGVLVLVALFAVGSIANVPGIVFVAAAVTLYGGHRGYLVALVGAILSVNLTFALGRATGLGNDKLLERPMIAKIVAWLHRRPVLSVGLLRLLVVVSPPVNYALSLTKLRFRDFAIGSAVGLVIPVGVQVAGIACLFG